ncbi:hypothetical protein CFIO01_02755 [Colletotrichum fioriniae PJ7]|uniref:Protein NO VEIN C-terminal domain-containing protein n=1 Tax=Colletotrichum fioriniae PJ7 TaxID=1445577 RepID=A0A010R6Y8_9PEZI|nr:hypothetical protein CFIO01_02755 [Colletotrichum fioriniae PJ7]
MAAAPGPTAHQPTARQLVERIAEEHGIISESDLTEIGTMNQRIRSVVEKALLQKDQLIGSSILTLAKNLNTSHARFVFELLQNADDNKYVAAKSRGVEPCVKFSVYRDRIKIECNEDGFTYHDLKAICAIGQSSKNRSQGYIGEKGIGFKSVFMAAYKVNILSKDFSFSFTHRKGDSGLGMVTPVWEPDFIPQNEQAPSSITLHLHQYDDASVSEAMRQREEINREFENLPITVLLFLRNLRRIEIQFHDDGDGETKRVKYSFSNSSSSTLIERVWLSDYESSSGETVQRKHHVTRQVIRDAPPNENREFSEGNGRADAETEIILVFPLTDDHIPIIENQPVFAFLPMMPLGFKFVIQADFVTNSSREGILISSARNLAIRDGIATCFVKAVEEMCQHPTLRFQWMRWLPQRHAYPWDSFWNGLLDDIVSRIKTIKTLRTRRSGHLGDIHSLRRLQSNWLDDAGSPLFDDLNAEVYVAKEYEVKDLSLLEPYGLKWLSADDRLARMEHDLGQPTDDPFTSPAVEMVSKFPQIFPYLWPDACVWTAPGVPYAYTALEGQLMKDCSEGRSDALQKFIKGTLGIGNWDENCCIQELKHMKEANCDDFDWIVEIYDFLNNCDMSESQLKDFRTLFRTTPLIFVPKGETSGWCTTTECLWSSGAKIRGRTTLSSIYEDLEDFFVEKLGVQRLTLSMACDELLQKGNGHPTATIAEVKETIWAVNTLLQSAKLYPDPEQLLESAIFPVEDQTGQIGLETGRTQFVIRDRKPLAEMFASKVKFLDFSLDEVHRLSNFFSWLGFDSRYLSSSVKEISTVASDFRIKVQRPDRDIKRRAGGICRVASHFNSPRMDDVLGLYHTLCATEVFETHGISSEVHLVQDAKAHIHVKPTSELHIREAAGRLEIYVPLNKEGQDFCYHSSLPRRLLEWVMTEPETQICGAIPHRAISAMSSALNAPIQSVSQILEAEGIIDIGGIIEDDQEQDFKRASHVSPLPAENPQREGFAVDLPTRPFSLTASRSVSGPAIIHPTLTQPTSTPASLDSNGSYPLQPTLPVSAAAVTPPSHIFHFGQASTAPTATTPPRYDAFAAEYLRILNNVIFAARRGSFPAYGSSRTGQSTECVSTPTPNPWIPPGSDKKIGAAGELFVSTEDMSMITFFDTILDDSSRVFANRLQVYELLSHLSPSLPGFGMDDWQSTMRKHVAVHPEYSYVTPWEGQETADIVYDDKFGVLTEILVEKGYLERAKWIGKKPHYLIEVKTTPGDAARPFFVSKYQYNRMRDHTDASASLRGSCTVYMLIRVFNLTNSDINFIVYMDPYALQQDGTLVFTEHTWQVVPM